MKIKITRQTFVQGKLVKPGDVFENLPDKDVYNLLGANKAVKFTDEKASGKNVNDEYLQLVEEMSEKDFFAAAKSLDVDVKGLKRPDANLIVADAMRKSEQ